MDSILVISLLIFLVAVLYASVGHGGASGYLAILSFFAYSPNEMATTALLLNLLVAGVAFYQYARAGFLKWPLTWPFLAASIPMAYVGGLFNIPHGLYFVLLAGVLFYAALRMSLAPNTANPATGNSPEALCPPKPVVALPTAGGIGLLSGVIGVGGGIFLSPVMILFKWATPKQTAATSACFIWLNSLAGLAGRATRGGLEWGTLWPFLIAGGLGSVIGAYYGARFISNHRLRQLLGGVLFMAAVKMVLKVF
ncbi:MAG: sulfite exporter TauE/SafE family protein [Cyanobacteria bacterium HKST-UBA03]|nr:sulfite exporter TauE/SafE family protein [Cyanobacteria bacterium HKST-UBA03]